jgi:hypothetical protein
LAAAATLAGGGGAAAAAAATAVAAPLSESARRLDALRAALEAHRPARSLDRRRVARQTLLAW